MDKVRSRIRGASQGNFPLIPVYGGESWKYTDLRSVDITSFKQPHAAQSSQVASAISLTPTVTVNNGFVTTHQIPTGVLVASLRDLYGKKSLTDVESSLIDSALGSLLSATDDNGYVSANNEWLEDGVVIHVAKGVEVKEPVIISHRTSAATVSYPRVLVVAEPQSSLTVVESFEGEAETYLTIPVTELCGKAGARINHVKIQLESTSAYHLGTIASKADKDTVISSHLVNLGGAVVRNDISGRCDDVGTNIHLYGLTVVGQRQHVDNSTLLDHALPHGESRELYKGIYAGEARGVFTGTIIVREDAQKTNAFQQNQSILLSAKAEINSRPQLKIWADDVKCTHGATVGQLDKEALFYLLSRGISHQEAQAMLVKAFAGEVLAALPSGEIRQVVEALVDAKLNSF